MVRAVIAPFETVAVYEAPVPVGSAMTTGWVPLG